MVAGLVDSCVTLGEVVNRPAPSHLQSGDFRLEQAG